MPESVARTDPIVIGGGPCAYNPEPIAEFFDLFYIGEGETVYDPLLDLYKECKQSGGIPPGISAPCCAYSGHLCAVISIRVTYKEDGTIASFTPMEERHTLRL